MDLPALTWAFLALAAFLTGLSKTAIPGINTVSVALAAALLPAKASTGLILLLFMVGDIFALAMYRKHAHWPTLLGMIPAVLLGLLAGVLFLAQATDSGVKQLIGAILLAALCVTFWQRHTQQRAGAVSSQRGSRARRLGYGALAGFTTTVANAGGPMMSMYFLAARFDVKAFLGTAAWFFAVVNLCKLPFSLGLGIITPDSLAVASFLAPAVVIGAFLGRFLAGIISQTVFDRLVGVTTLLGALYLLLD